MRKKEKIKKLKKKKKKKINDKIKEDKNIINLKDKKLN